MAKLNEVLDSREMTPAPAGGPYATLESCAGHGHNEGRSLPENAGCDEKY